MRRVRGAFLLGVAFVLACAKHTPVAPPALVENKAPTPIANALSLTVFPPGDIHAPVGSGAVRLVRVENWSDATVTVTDARVGQAGTAFTMSGLFPPFDLAPGAGENLTVWFRPTLEGPATADVVVKDRDGEHHLAVVATGDPATEAAPSVAADAADDGGLGAMATAQSRAATDPSDVQIMGGMDSGLINAVVRRHMPEVRYCYQRELVANPAFAEKLSVKFVIAGDGTVGSAVIGFASNPLASFESCITTQFFKMQFPAPANHGIVIVKIPLTFSPG